MDGSLVKSANLCVIICVLSSSFHGVHAIDCYSCTSSDDGCGENVDNDILLRNGKVESGCSSCVKSFSALGTIWSSVTRSCGFVYEDSCENILGYGRCSCTTTFCNGVKASTSGKLLLPVVVLLCVLLL